MKLYHSLLILVILLSISCKKSDEDFKAIENKMVSYIQNDEWEKLFTLIKEKEIPFGFTEEQKKRLEELTNEIIVQYKDFRLKESIGRKDTIMYGFVLNASDLDFFNRIMELRKEFDGGFELGEYRFRNSLLDYNYSINGYKQHFIGEGVDCDLIINIDKGEKVHSIGINSSNCKSNSVIGDPFEKLLSSKYGTILDIPSPTGYDSKMKSHSHSWEGVYYQIKNNRFNVFQFYFLSNKEIFEYEKYPSIDNIIFNDNFVIHNDILTSKFMTYEEFFKDYELRLKEVKEELEKSEKNVF